jgi:hypothetical protein
MSTLISSSAPSLANTPAVSIPVTIPSTVPRAPADFSGDTFPSGIYGGMLMGPRNFAPAPARGFEPSGGGLNIGPRVDPPGPFGRIGKDPDNDIFIPQSNLEVPKRKGPAFM